LRELLQVPGWRSSSGRVCNAAWAYPRRCSGSALSRGSCWQRFWLVDPLDGTKEFISRNGEFTVNIALIEDGRPVLGVVLAPALGRLFAGCEGSGAFVQEGSVRRAIRCRDVPADGLERRRVVVGLKP